MTFLLILIMLANSLCANGQPTVDPRRRVDCYPDPGASAQACNTRGCIWDNNYDASHPTIPLCYFPASTGYQLSASGLANPQVILKKISSPGNPFGADMPVLNVWQTTLGATLNVKIGPGGGRNPSTSSDSLQLLTFDNNMNTFTIQIKRHSRGTNIWDTSIGGLLFADNYIQIATLLPSDRLYGFGENIHLNLKHDMTKYTTWPMFARDEFPYSAVPNTKNLYGVHPFYICLEMDGNAHGVLFLNSNAQEVTTGMGPHLVYRTTGGLLDLYFFPGPKPEDVITQYLALIGTPMLPAYWSLGFQLCRWGYTGLQDMQAAVNRTIAAGIPLDVPYADIDYMNHDKDFSYGTGPWGGFPRYVNQLQNQGMHVILIFDPAIEVDYGTYTRGLQQNASFVEWPLQRQVPANNALYNTTNNTLTMLGVVWPDRHVAFPDFLDPTNSTTNWWASEFAIFHSEVNYDGIWIDMNEPSNFGTNQQHPWYCYAPPKPCIPTLFCPVTGFDSALDSPPYKTQAVYQYGDENSNWLSTKTLCMLGKSARRTMNIFDTHSLYGWSEARATRVAIERATGHRGAIISRSTFVSSGRWAGHWLGDNTAAWADLQTSVIGAMEFNFFGIPYVGSDICGFNGSPTEELCLRWQQMGAFHPFSRNHNARGAPPQDPGTWPSVAAAARKALMFRYHYLPYLYSLHFEASLHGHTVIRPLFFEFPQDTLTHTVSTQFLWGSSFLVTPVLNPNVTTVQGYFPSEIWFSIYEYGYATIQQPGMHTLRAPTTSMIPVHVRGGSILPRQAPATTTTQSRQNPFELLIAIGSFQPGMTNSASGQLYWDDGRAIADNLDTYNYYHFQFNYNQTATSATLTLQRKRSPQAPPIGIPTLSIIELLGYNYFPNLQSFTLDGTHININPQLSSYSPFTKRFYIETSNLVTLSQVGVNQPSVLTWQHSSTRQ